jgi:hypothetical protein
LFLLLLLPGLLMTSLVTLLEHPSEVRACSNFAPAANL